MWHGGPTPGPSPETSVGYTLEMIVGYSDSTLFLHDYIYGVRGDRVETVFEVEAKGKW